MNGLNKLVKAYLESGQAKDEFGYNKTFHDVVVKNIDTDGHILECTFEYRDVDYDDDIDTESVKIYVWNLLDTLANKIL